jgi:endoglucanase
MTMKSTIKIVFTLFLSIIIHTSLSYAQTLTENIRINQIGYFVDGIKKAVLVDFSDSRFEIWKSDLSQKVYSGTMTKRAAWAVSCEGNVQLADFSSFNREGTYIIIVGNKKSNPFVISNSVLDSVSKAQMKFYYFNRCSAELQAKNAGKWARPAGHLNTEVTVYEDQKRKINLSGGWYDAGDYGLYMVTGSIAACQIMMSYEQFPDYWNKTPLNIPETGNGVPDILNEVKWELRWMYKMKDTDDGVWYKMTSKNHSGFIMPDKEKSPFYCMVKNATSAYDYAATFAMAARVFKRFNTNFSGFADSCQLAATLAWKWAVKNESTHPACINPSDVHTGEYGDDISSNGNDNKVMAAVEMFILTGDSSYLQSTLQSAQNGLDFGEPNWNEKRPLATLELALHGDVVAQKNVLKYAQSQLQFQDTNSYNVNIGNTADDFNWGSNRRISNRATVLMAAYILTKDKKYLDGVTNAMDYVLGRNASGYCFITGFGSKQVLFPHHRVSGSDGIIEPIPGLPIQGPFNGTLGHPCIPQVISNCAAKNYFDHECSYVTNEQCIDEGSAHVFNLGGLMNYLGQYANKR